MLLEDLLSAVQNDDLSKVAELFDKNGSDMENLVKQHFGDLLHNIKSKDMMRILWRDPCVINGCSLLTYSVQQKFDIEIVKSIISWGVDINGFDGNLVTPLCEAVSQNDLNFVEDIIKLGAEVNGPIQFGQFSPLHLANSKEMVSLLIKYGADVNFNSTVSSTPLNFALKSKKSKDVVIELIKNGADVNSTLHDKSPLMYALINKYEAEVIYELVNNGANIKYVSSNYNYSISTMNILNFTTDTDIIKFLLKKGADINGSSRMLTPLVKALITHDYNLTKFFLENGANPNSLHHVIRQFISDKQMNIDKNFNLLSWYGADFSIQEVESVYGSGFYLGCGIYLKFKQLRKIPVDILKHILLCINFDTDICPPFLNNIDSTFFEKSKLEYDKLKSTFVTEDLTFYDICKQNYDKFVHVSQFENVVVLESSEYLYNIDQIRLMFPIFKNIIIFRLKRHYFDNYRRELNIKLNQVIFENSTDPLQSQEEQSFCCKTDNVIDSLSVHKLELDKTSFQSSERVMLNYDCLYIISDYLSESDIFNLLLASL